MEYNDIFILILINFYYYFLRVVNMIMEMNKTDKDGQINDFDFNELPCPLGARLCGIYEIECAGRSWLYLG